MKKLIWGLLIQYQIFHTYIIKIAWQILRRITYEILGVKGLIFLVLNYPCFLFSLFLYLSRRLTWLVLLLWLVWFNSLPKTTTKHYWLELALSPGNEKYITKKICYQHIYIITHMSSLVNIYLLFYSYNFLYDHIFFYTVFEN